MTDAERQIVEWLRYLADSACDDRAGGAYDYAADSIEQGEHRRHAPRIEARSDKTAQQAWPEGREPDGEAGAPRLQG